MDFFGVEVPEGPTQRHLVELTLDGDVVSVERLGSGSAIDTERWMWSVRPLPEGRLEEFVPQVGYEVQTPTGLVSSVPPNPDLDVRMIEYIDDERGVLCAAVQTSDFILNGDPVLTDDALWWSTGVGPSGQAQLDDLVFETEPGEGYEIFVVKAPLLYEWVEVSGEEATTDEESGR